MICSEHCDREQATFGQIQLLFASRGGVAVRENLIPAHTKRQALELGPDVRTLRVKPCVLHEAKVGVEQTDAR